jgi:ABC-type arginine transport system ATPase subunit
MPLKYVMLKLDGGEFLPLLFPEFMQHSDMARSIPATVVSAGHVYLENGKIVASGASSSVSNTLTTDSGENYPRA